MFSIEVEHTRRLEIVDMHLLVNVWANLPCNSIHIECAISSIYATINSIDAISL